MGKNPMLLIVLLPDNSGNCRAVADGCPVFAGLSGTW